MSGTGRRQANRHKALICGGFDDVSRTFLVMDHRGFRGRNSSKKTTIFYFFPGEFDISYLASLPWIGWLEWAAKVWSPPGRSGGMVYVAPRRIVGTDGLPSKGHSMKGLTINCDMG